MLYKVSTQKITKSRREAEDEFNVKNALSKLKSRNNNLQVVTEDGERFNNNLYESGKITNELFSDSTTQLVDLNDKMHSRYDKLKDDFNTRFSEIKKDNDEKYGEIKKDIGKFEGEHLKTDTFRYIIGGVIAFFILLAGVIYTLSYSDTLTNIKENKKDIESIKTDIKEIKNTVSEIKSKNHR